MCRRVAQNSVLTVFFLTGCISTKYYDKPSTPLSHPIRISNNTQTLLDVRYAGKLVKSRLSPNDTFDLYPGTWGTPQTYIVIVIGFDASGNFVGTASREFHFTPYDGMMSKAIVQSLADEGITGGRKTITIEDLNSVGIAKSFGGAIKALSPKKISENLHRQTPPETWVVTALIGPRSE